MKICGEWRKIKSLCKHCDAPIEARPVWGLVPLVINGAEPMEYRHAEYGCKNPEVYNCWNKI